MNVNAVANLPALPAAMLGATNATASPGTAGFSQAVQRFIDETNKQQVLADQSVEMLATGQTDSIHETVLALTKADLSLRVFMEVRNKVIDAYQEIMRMQL